ncbi:hypothetical protein [Candidatus Accumulibacter sp. ACC007]|uniref:hypothetical protein n=1 Tax=Candidatus Accumulibacter sp. ACC007 TaxID=2823333 RepID=UPI0025C5497F|nr:hypothetical protein [Candidatus Accumulibacter sp. ACC007]
MALFLPEKETPPAQSTARFEATLSRAAPAIAQASPPRPPRPATPAKPPTPATRPAPPAPPPAKRAPAKAAVKKPAPVKPSKPQPPPQPQVIAIPEAAAPAVPDTKRWFTGEKMEMKHFLDDLETQATAPAKPSLAQRSLAMARGQGQQQARQDEEGTATVELLPNMPPPDPFSLDFYLDSLVKRLNRSAAFVRNDPRSKGVRLAAVHFRINPDGSLKTFKVLNAGDQQDEIAFIKSVVERAIPFAAFPPAVARSARSLGITICIQPSSGGNFGFSRTSDGRAC